MAARAQVEVRFSLCTGNCPPELAREEAARTAYNLAIHHLLGDLSLKRDEKAAFHTMERAAAMEFGPAETRLGQFYSAGTGTALDKGKALELFDRAAFHGDAEGEYELGKLYRAGAGVSSDPALALKLFTRAAQQGLAEAEFALGMAFETGEATSPDLSQAVKWYRKSAAQGVSVAQYRLAKLYWSGSAGKRDEVAALQWAILAERNGIKEASIDAQQYRSAMSPNSVAEAESHAARFKPAAPNAKNWSSSGRLLARVALYLIFGFSGSVVVRLR